MKRYSELLEQWEQEAYHDGYGADWLADVGEGIKYYAMNCEANGRRPTFAGLIRYIDRKRCRPPEGDAGIDFQKTAGVRIAHTFTLLI